MKRPLLTDAVTGYRAFVVARGGRLFSQYADIEWPSFPNVTFRAKCESGKYFASMPTFTYLKNPDDSESFVLAHDPCLAEHAAPHKDCGCGIHALYDVGDVHAHSLSWDTSGVLYGLIAGWGEVIPHPDGFRCSHARICALAGRGLEAENAAENCEVDLVEHRSELVELAPRFGSPMPSRLRPPALLELGCRDQVVGSLLGMAS